MVTVTSATPRAPTLFPLTSCSSETGDMVTLGCLATEFTPSSVTFLWTKSGTALTDFIQYPPVQKGEFYMGVSQVQVRRQDWEAKLPFKCAVTHPDGSPSIDVIPPPPPARDLPTLKVASTVGGSEVSFSCYAKDFSPKEYEIKWLKDDGDVLNKVYEIKTPIKESQNDGKTLYSVASFLMVPTSDLRPNSTKFTCEFKLKNENALVKTVTYGGSCPEPTPITVTLNPPSPKKFFNNDQAELECIVEGQDNTIVSETEITWQIDGKNVAGNMGLPKTAGSQYSKTNTLTRSLTEWLQVNTVRCSAKRKDVTVTKDLTLHKGDRSEPKVAVHILSEEDIRGNSDVTLVCLVSSSVQKDYYIAWSDDAGQKTGNYVDGITFLPQKTQHGYSVTSVYTIKKDKWNQQRSVFNCNVWPVRSNKSMITRGVSKATEMNIAVSCTDDSTEEDEFSSLWSTTSSFIFLFIFTLFYNMIFSLVKMKSQ